MLIALLFALCFAPPVSAQSQAAQRVVLTNGVRLILKPEAESKFTAFTIFVRMPASESTQDTAIGDVVAQALFFGSSNHTYEKIRDSLAQTGSLQTSRTADYVAITCLTSKEQFSTALYYLCESLKNAEFAPDALERACRALREERQKRDEDDFERCYAELCAPLTGRADPTLSALMRVTQSQAVAYFQKHYVPARTVISIVGDFDPNAVRREVDNNLADYDRPTVRLHPSNAPALPAASRKLTFDVSGHAAYAFAAVPAPPVTSPDYPAFAVLQMLLGGGHASRLFRQVRDTLGVGYDVGAVYRAERAEPLVAYLEWDNRRTLLSPTAPASSPTDLLNAQMDALVSHLPTDAELSRARNFAIGRDALRHERLRDRAFYLGWYECMGLNYTYDTEFPRLLANVSQADLLRVAKTYLTPRISAFALPKDN